MKTYNDIISTLIYKKESFQQKILSGDSITQQKNLSSISWDATYNKLYPETLKSKSFGNSFIREEAMPLDRFSIFPSFDTAKDYALSNTIAYEGQLVAVDDGDKQTVYVLDSRCNSGLRRVSGGDFLSSSTQFITINGISSVGTDSLSVLSVSNNFDIISSGLELSNYFHKQKDLSGNFTSLRVGVQENNSLSSIGRHSVAFGNKCKALSSYSFANGYDTSAVGSYSIAVGSGTYSGQFGFSEGFQTTCLVDYGHSFGYQTLVGGFNSVAANIQTSALAEDCIACGTRAVAVSSDDGSFVWSGIQNNKDTIYLQEPYYSKGIGTFSINPKGGTAGFFIGINSLDTIINEKIVSNGYISKSQLSNCLTSITDNVDDNKLEVIFDCLKNIKDLCTK